MAPWSIFAKAHLTHWHLLTYTPRWISSSPAVAATTAPLHCNLKALAQPSITWKRVTGAVVSLLNGASAPSGHFSHWIGTTVNTALFRLHGQYKIINNSATVTVGTTLLALHLQHKIIHNSTSSCYCHQFFVSCIYSTFLPSTVSTTLFLLHLPEK